MSCCHAVPVTLTKNEPDVSGMQEKTHYCEMDYLHDQLSAAQQVEVSNRKNGCERKAVALTAVRSPFGQTFHCTPCPPQLFL